MLFIGVGKVAEARELALEMQLHRADRAVTLFSDDDFGHVMRLFHISLPGHMFRRAFRRHPALDVVFLTEYEHDDVRVLFDRARFAQVRQLRPLVGALLDGAAQLRQRQQRH